MSGWPSLDDQGFFSAEGQFPPSCENVSRLIARREICPRTKGLRKKQPRRDREDTLCKLKNEAMRDARAGLFSWAEEESLRHLAAKYCLLDHPPKSTIAAAFSRDGGRLASTHGDHTVKIIDSESGTCLNVLRGHQRTPWVVRFHPKNNEILASGSLDHEVRVWDATTSECIASRYFYRPIASIAFHPEGEFLAVASGHKLYLWQYKGSGESSSPLTLLKTRRTLRAVHFHPHAAPFLLTAEVSLLDSSDPSMSRPMSLGCLHYSLQRLNMTNLRLMEHLRVSAKLPPSPMPLSSLYPSSSAIRVASLSIPTTSLMQSGSGMPQQLGNLSLSPQIDSSEQRIDIVPAFGMIQSAVLGTVAATPNAELPCTVKLRIWSHDTKNVSELLDNAKCRLTIQYAVLCSEMGAHFSPCGRYLAVCVACMLPEVEAESVRVSQVDTILYELRIYSLEESTFGSVLVSRAVKAAHCLTSIQFSPTSEHLLLAYGRRHNWLLKSFMMNGETIPVYTVLELYRVSDLHLVSVLPSVEDEVNVACFQPLVGGGLVYGTKEGRLRFLKYDGAYKMNYGRTNMFPAAKLAEVQAYAL